MTLVGLSSAMVEVTTLGACFNQIVSWDEWTDIGYRLGHSETALRWAIGDWIVYGYERFGSDAVQFASESGLARQTIANTSSVCRRIPIGRRRSELPFTHHEEVAHLEPRHQDRLLECAVTERLSCAALRVLVRDETETRNGFTVNSKSVSNGHGSDSVPDQPEPEPSSAASVAPVVTRVTLVVTGPVDERVLADGVSRVRDGLEAWLAGHGFNARVDVA